MSPDISAIFAALDASWPAAALHHAGPWLIREGRGGGKRVSAATAERPEALDAIAQMEAAQHSLGQDPLVMIRGEDQALDAKLEALGYRIVDPVVVYLAPVSAMVAELPPVAAVRAWPPLAIQSEIWAEGGIDASRIAVMERASAPRISLIARAGDRAAGTAFVGSAGDVAMLHALEVAADRRRQGAARTMLQEAANWARDEGIGWLSLVVTEANAGARALYASLGMAPVGQYHYRHKT